MASVLALVAAATFGTSDFLGGLAARRSAVIGVVALSQLSALLLLALVVPFVPGDPIGVDLAWGAGSGLAGGAGLIVFYRALARGSMGVVAPVTAVTAAGLPLAAGLALGERPGGLAMTGVGLALVAIALVSRTTPPVMVPAVLRRWRALPGPGSGVGSALLAGSGFALFFVLIAQVDPASGLWPLLSSRMGAVVLVVSAGLATRRALMPQRGARRTSAAAGALDMLATVLLLLAMQRGLLSLVAVLSSLAPVSTVALAATLLGERLGRVQLVGLAAAILAVALISVGQPP